MVLEGPLTKRSDWTRRWQERFFRYENGTLCYYLSSADSTAKGTIAITDDLAAVIARAWDNGFILTSAGKQICLAAPSEEAQKEWIDGINRLVAAKNTLANFETVKVVFGEGSLGVNLVTDKRVDSPGCAMVRGIKPGSAAAIAKVQANDTMLKVNDTDISFGVSTFKDALSLIKKAGRPLYLTFGRKVPPKTSPIAAASSGEASPLRATPPVPSGEASPLRATPPVPPTDPEPTCGSAPAPVAEDSVSAAQGEKKKCGTGQAVPLPGSPQAVPEASKEPIPDVSPSTDESASLQEAADSTNQTTPKKLIIASVSSHIKTPLRPRISSTGSTSSVDSPHHMRIPTPSKLDLQFEKPDITPAEHTEWIQAMRYYKPRVEVTDPESATEGSRFGSSHVEYRVVTTTTDVIPDEVRRVLSGGSETSALAKGTKSVLRRYKDFLWLQKTLLSRYTGMCIPPVPEKRRRASMSALRSSMKTSKRAFIGERMRMLQIFLGRVMDNPYLRADAAVNAFISVQEREKFEVAKLDQARKAEPALSQGGYNWSHIMWIAFVERGIPALAEKVVGTKSDSDRKVIDTALQVGKLLAALLALIKTSARINEKTGAVADRFEDLGSSVKKWREMEEKAADPTMNEYATPNGAEVLLVLRSLGLAVRMGYSKAQERYTEFDSLMHLQLKFMELELRQMQSLLKKQQDLVARAEVCKKKVAKWAKTKDFSDDAQTKHAQASDQFQSLGKAVSFLESGLLTFTIDRFRKQMKDTFLRMFAQIASSSLRNAKDGEMMCTHLMREVGVADEAAIASATYNVLHDCKDESNLSKATIQTLEELKRIGTKPKK